MERFGDRIAVAVTMNEPNLARLLTWIDLPPVVRDLERATLQAASEAAGVPRYRLAQRHAARGDGRHGRRDDRRSSRGPGRDQGAPARPSGGVVAGDHRRRGGWRRPIRTRPQARRGVRALARAGPGRRLPRSAELRADPLRRRRGGAAAGRRSAQPDGQCGRARVAGRCRALRVRDGAGARPGDRARHVNLGRHASRGVHRAVAARTACGDGGRRAGARAICTGR